MNQDTYDRYRGLLEADERYRGGPRIRDEVCLRTACGCEKLVAMPRESHIYQQRVEAFDKPWETRNFNTNVTCTIRRFIYDGETDSQGRRLFRERLDPEDWKGKYQKLYNDVYGMDKGL